MLRAWRASKRDRLAHWLVPASVLHAASVLVAAALSPRPVPERAAPRPGAIEPNSSIELTLLDGSEASAVQGAAPSHSRPFDASPPATGDALRERSAGVSGAHGVRAGIASVTRRAAVNDHVAHAATSELPAGEEASASAPSSEPSRSASPRLSLEELGVGTNPFLDLRVQPPTKEEQANARLQAALREPSLERERQRGLGPASPVVSAARRLVLADEGLLETSAVLNVRVDSAGRVSEIHVLEASSQSKAWQWMAARLRKALESATLPNTGPAPGWDMKLRLVSSVELPSGRAPGLRLGVLGQQIAGSGGPRSTSLELSPTSKLDLKEPIDPVGRHMAPPIPFETMLLKWRADPIDIGAPARRVVEVAVLAIRERAAP